MISKRYFIIMAFGIIGYIFLSLAYNRDSKSTIAFMMIIFLMLLWIITVLALLKYIDSIESN